MKKNHHIPVAFRMPEVIQFLTRSDYNVEEQIKNLKIEHNHLKDKYFEIIEKSRFPRIQLVALSKEYNQLLIDTCQFASVNEHTPYISIIREIYTVVEATMFAIWRYMYSKNYCS